MRKLHVHSFESFGTHDGPGIRMVIFLQGCNLKCIYCQNPDAMLPNEGSYWEISDLVNKAKRMKSYFGLEGGVTISGGEPMLQSPALIELLKELQAEGIHTNIDTNGTIKTKSSDLLLSEVADLVMFDIKQTHEDDFKTMTNHNGFANLIHNIKLREASKKPYWFRYVLVPGYTDTEESLTRVIEYFSHLEYLERLEVLPYHQLGEHKWETLGWEYPLKGQAVNTPENLLRVEQFLQPHFDNLLVRK